LTVEEAERKDRPARAALAGVDGGVAVDAVEPATTRTVEVPGPDPTSDVAESSARIAPAIHVLAPETVAQIEAALPKAEPAFRIAAVGGPPSALPRDLAALLTGEVADLRHADVLLICPQEDDEEHLGPDLSALGRACEQVVADAVPGQTLIMTSASYVGCARDLLVVPLIKRGLVPGIDIHVAVSPEPLPGAPERGARIVGGATPACTVAAATVLQPAGPVAPALTLEDAETVSLTSHAPTGLGALAKRVLDFVGAGLGLLALAPLMGIVAAAIKLDSPGPVLFTQVRVGEKGRLFRFVKFRTMANGAEERLTEVLHLNTIKGPAFQIEEDPRVTRVGRFLRRSSFDELPQLWNVLRGSMSLVGPRPSPIVEVAAYKPWHRRRLAMKPGLTGLAQVRARKYNHFDVKAGLDLQYIDHWSLWLDVRILFETVPAVLRFTGR
jgi:lipopolysaccharide/colanic/teichoic acid biosynthesis glycosyltransferase